MQVVIFADIFDTSLRRLVVSSSRSSEVWRKEYCLPSASSQFFFRRRAEVGPPPRMNKFLKQGEDFGP